MFSIKESLKYGWQKFKDNIEICLLSTSLILILSYIGDKLHWFVSLIFAILSIIIIIGYTKVFLRITSDENPNFKDIFREYNLFLKYLITNILQSLATLGGLILLIVPGIIFALQYSFALLVLIDTKISPLESMKRSSKITKGKKWKLLGFYIVICLINILGLALIKIGLLVSIPVSMFAHIYVYRELSKDTNEPVETASPHIA